MKRIRIISISAIFALLLISCIVDSSWLKLVGRWQDTATHSYEIEFTQGGQFEEYYNGQKIQWGEFIAEGKRITLNYKSPCGNKGVPCTVILTFDIQGNNVIFTESGGTIEYQKIK